MSELNYTSKVLLSAIAHLDSYGAQEWSLRAVTATSAAIFIGMRMAIGHKYNIDWDAFVHAIISGFGSAVCIYLNMYAAVAMNGISEPLASVQCNGPLTSLHRIIPAITQGYAICDIINGFRLGPAFLAHGFATFTVAAIFNEVGGSHLITPLLLMEISTIVLAVLRSSFFTPTHQLITQASFFLLFVITRILLCPMLHYDLVSTMYEMNHKMEECFPKYIFYVLVVFGIFFNGLNLFWFIKLIKKVKRKLTKEEDMEMKDLNEE
mmetsp:Transcript_2633/g.3505  ORF Transcript_2633/g.3505 Transcript_2633/m.3505 type:complete len:265 (-) Transcript_2633:783-1577(-)